MKQIIYIFLISLAFVSCSSKNEMKLTGTVKGLKKGTLILQKIKDTTLVSIDSVKINGSSDFTFSTEIESPQLYYLYVRLKDGTLVDDRISFFAQSGEINIKTSLKKFATDAIVTGSPNQEKLKEHDRLMQRYNNKRLDYIKEGFRAAQENNDSLVAVLNKNQERITKSKYLATVNFAINNKDSEVAPFLATTAISNANRTLLDTIYSSLTPRVKNSYYGKKLKQLLDTIE